MLTLNRSAIVSVVRILDALTMRAADARPMPTRQGTTIAQVLRDSHAVNLRDAAAMWLITLNDKPVPAEMWHDTDIAWNDGDVLRFCEKPGELSTGIMIGIAILSAVASAVLSASVRAPAVTGSDQSPQRRYGFNRISNDAFVGDAIPVVMGERRYGGKVVAKVPVESEDGSGDGRLKLLICLGWGEIEKIADRTADFDEVPGEDMTGLWLNDQPIANFAGVKVSGRTGTSGQRVLPGFADIETLREVGVGGVTLPNTSGSERTGGSASGEAYLFSTLAAVDAVVCRVRLPNGLYSITGSGQVETRAVKFRLRTRLSSGPGTWSAWRVITLERADQSEFFSSPRVELNTGGGSAMYDIQLERVSAEGDATVVDKLIWDSVVEVTHSAETYPHLAMLALDLTAGEQLTGEPRVSVQVKGVKCRVWDGVSDPDDPDFDTEWTDNPAYHVLEILTNTTWGMGSTYNDTNIDMATLIEAAEYAGESVARPLGGTRPRFACNIVLDSQREGVDWLRTVCQTMRAVPITSGTIWRIVVDKPRPAPVEVFTDGSIALDDNGLAKFEYRRELGTGGVTRANRLVGQFENAMADFQADTLAFPDYGESWLATEPVQEESQRMDGVTDPDQVAAELVYRMQRLRSLTRSIRFTPSRAAIVVQPGDRFDIAFQLPAWGTASGRCGRSSTATTIRIDRTVTLESGQTYVVTLVRLDGSVETRTINSPDGTYAPGDEISVATAFTSAPLEFEEYVVGKVGISTKPFLCTAVRAADTKQLLWELEGVEYAAGIYTDNGGEVDLPDYSELRNLTTPPGPVGNLRAYERTVGTDIITRSIELAWVQTPADAEITGSFRIYRRRVGTETWVLVPNATVARRGAVIEIVERDVGYEFCVVAVSLGGAFLSPLDPRHLIASLVFGLSTPPPPAPTGMALTQTGGNTYTLSWDEVDGAVGYQVLSCGDTTSLPNVGAEDCLVLARTVEAELTGLELPPSQQCRFFVRSIGLNGRLSFTAATVSIATPATPPGQSIALTRTFTLNSEGTLTNLTWASSRLELVSAGTAGVYLSPEVDLTTIAATELTIRPATANDADDPTLNSDPFIVPSIAADQWGVVSSGPSVVGMLMPPWPDAAQTWKFEIRTFDGTVWSDWATWPVYSAINRTISKYQIRVTMTRASAPYRPALRGLKVVATR